MRPLDWVVFFSWLVFIIGFGLYRARASGNINSFLLGGRSLPWYAMGLSIMATQASAVTFISTTGQGYVDGMRFVQFYFGLPIAMVLICMTAVPIFHRANIYTAYEYLEKRFDAKTRALVGLIFLIQRGFACGISLYAPAVALSVVLGWSDQITTVLMGTLIVIYTTTGGIKAVTWSDVLQMMMMFAALILSLAVAIHLLPHDVSFVDALHIAGAAGRLRAVDLHWDLSNRYNVWSGLIGGTFLALAYFGCDQSQVQRYLAGKSISESRLSLLFNAIAKIPMQAFILFIGAMVFALFTFIPAPAIFQPIEAKRAAQTQQWPQVDRDYQKAFVQRRDAAYSYLDKIHSHAADEATARDGFLQADSTFKRARQSALGIVEKLNNGGQFDDTNYIFLTFVRSSLPVGLIGLLIAVIFTASMSSTSGEINSLATVSTVDIYRRFVAKDKSDHHYLNASRWLTAFWGTYAIVFAAWGARGFGALIERVNIVGSLFYGGLLGVFILAFFFKRVQGTAAFWGVIAGEIMIFAANLFTSISYLWYNVIGCFVVVVVALLLTAAGLTTAAPQQRSA